MRKYKVNISKTAAKELRLLPKEAIKAIYFKMNKLSDEPRPTGCIKLSGYKEDLWRIRHGNYRIVYSIEDEICVVDIRHIGDRKDIYN